MKQALLILALFASAAFAQEDGIMPAGWRPDWYVTASPTEASTETGEELWDELVRARQRLLERHAKNIYRDGNGKLWMLGEKGKIGEGEWYNLHTKERRTIRPRGVPVDAESVSAQELLGALLTEEVKLATFYRKRVKVAEAQYAKRQVGRRYNFGGGGLDGSGRRSGGYVLVYRRVLVEPARYEHRLFVRELRFPLRAIERKLDETRTED